MIPLGKMHFFCMKGAFVENVFMRTLVVFSIPWPQCDYLAKQLPKMGTFYFIFFFHDGYLHYCRNLRHRILHVYGYVHSFEKMKFLSDFPPKKDILTTSFNQVFIKQQVGFVRIESRFRLNRIIVLTLLSADLAT